MAQADFWSRERILVAGDSRVRRLMSVPDPVLAGNIDYAFEGGILVNDLVNLVDNNLADHHNVIILIGFVGDEVQKYSHTVSAEGSVNLLRSKECDPGAQILAAVQMAHAKWMALKSDRIILWSLPYYVDYVSYNAGKIGEFDVGDTLNISYDSSKRFVQFITRLKLQWVSESPLIPFCHLNRALFAGKNYRNLFKSFGASSSEHYRFPTSLMSDGLHPTATLATEMWKLLHKTILELHNKRSGRKLITAPVEEVASGSEANVLQNVPPIKSSFKHQGIGKGQKQNDRKPYAYKKIQVHSRKSTVYSRLADHREEEVVEEEIIEEEPPVAEYGNLSWRAPKKIMTSNACYSNPRDAVSQGPTRWSWSYHKRMVSEAKLAVYTRGLQEQAWAEGRLATIIRERGFLAASDGKIDSVNLASKKYMEKLHCKMNTPHPDAKLVMEDIDSLLPVENDEDSSSSTD